ncbi:hypothetical protein TL16_g04548 [Triparma laevis f. inornata]|uniref:Calponin-homology (CH) domain-containing protein n=1 Tax=Triparma laevis f. inornata TaxID=1714386 RepID=A0A9W7AFQ5_9STRA|nr:hypothetical protein TL16_g04548 [Triparma laevis f. inornata]
MMISQSVDKENASVQPTASSKLLPPPVSPSSRKPLTPRSKNSINTFSSDAPASKGSSNLMIFSPPSAKTAAPVKPFEVETVIVPVINLDSFGESIWLDFGSTNNLVGIPRSMNFKFTSSTTQTVKMEKNGGAKKGFTVSFTELIVSANTTSTASITWTPNFNGGAKETIRFKLQRGSAQIQCIGRAEGGSNEPEKNVILTTKPPKFQKKMKMASKTKTSTKQTTPPVPPTTLTANPTKIASKLASKLSTKQTPKPNATNPIKPSKTPSKTPKKSVHSRPKLTPKKTTTKHTKITYDANWADKQQFALTSWINYVFLPSDEGEHEEQLSELVRVKSEDSEDTKAEEAAQAAIDRAALRTLLIHRRYTSAKNASTDLFNNTHFQQIRYNLDQAVKLDKLKAREDRDMYRDLGLRGHIVNLLMSYQTEWLKVGLETMFGEEVVSSFAPKTPSSLSLEVDTAKAKQRLQIANKKQHTTTTGKNPLTRTQRALKRFIIERVLGDPELLAKYTKGKCKMPSGKFEKLYKQELRKASLQRVLLLVGFLDQSRQNNVLERVPCLFTPGSTEVKSTKELLNVLCRDFLSGEGNVVKHLAQMGLKITYEQKFIDEYDFSVSNLAVDLRDGVRLCRMAELLTNDDSRSLSKQLRVPAVSRLQKIANVKVALKALEEAGVALGGLQPKDVVDGNRSGVLSLLWRTVVHFSLSQLVDRKKVEQEIKDVRRARKRRAIMGGFKPSMSEDSEMEQELTSLLLTWCTEVCATFGTEITNFTTSFADGKALCLLIHYYHPALLPRADILPTTTDVNANSTIVLSQKDLLFNEQKNARLAKRTMSDLGGIPSMLRDFDTSCIPEEKSMVGCVAYLCSRLIESSSEIQACLVIQSAFRRFYGHKLLEKKKTEALIIWRWWKKYSKLIKTNKQVKTRKAGHKIKNFVVQCKKRRESIRASKDTRTKWINASTVLCNSIRMFLAKTVAAKLRTEKEAREAKLRAEQEAEEHKLQQQQEAKEQAAAVVISSGVRMLLAKNKIALVKQLNADHQAKLKFDSAIQIQRIFRGYAAATNFTMAIYGATMIQALARGFTTRIRYLKTKQSIVTLQAILRGGFVRVEIEKQDRAAVQIQKMFRCAMAQIEATVMLISAIRIQCFVRQFLARRIMAQRRVEVEKFFEQAMKQQIFDAGMLSLQKIVRGKKKRSNFLKFKNAAITLQSFFRGVIVRNEIFFAAGEIQRMWRGSHQQAKFIMMIFGSMRIQSFGRMIAQKREFTTILLSIKLIQNWFRNLKMLQGEKQTAAAVVIQTLVRGFVERTEFVSSVNKIIAVQSLARMKTSRAVFASTKNAVVAIQALARKNAAVETFQNAIVGSMVIQAAVRKFQAMRSFAKSIDACVKIQSVGRKAVAAKKVKLLLKQKKQVESATLIQSIVRKCQSTKVVKSALLVRNTKASTKIQALVRGVLARNEHFFNHFAATEIQRMWRGSRDQCQYMLMVIAAIKIQSFVRMDLQRTDFEVEKLAIGMIQRWWKCMILRKGEREVAAATKLQALIRGRQAQGVYVEKVMGAIMIQSVFKMAKARKAFKASVVGVKKIQAMARGKKQVKVFGEKVKGAVVVASFARSIVARTKFVKTINSTVKIQAQVRSFVARSKFARTLAARKIDAVVRIQGLFRGWSVRENLKFKNFAAGEIQRMWRGSAQQVKYITMVLSAIHVQSVFRMAIVRGDLKFKNFAACVIQCRFRSAAAKVKVKALKAEVFEGKVQAMGEKNAAKRIQAGARKLLRKIRIKKNVDTVGRYVRGFLGRKRAAARMNLVLGIQSMWRGRIVRKKTGKRMRVIRMKVALANKKALEMPEMRLGVRTQLALQVLLNSKRLAEIMRAVTTLEVSSRFSERCCEAFSAAGAPEVLFKLIRTCNRSLPHIELLQFTLMTISNVAKWEHLVDSVATEHSIDTLVDLIQTFRDKEILVVLCGELLVRLISTVDGCRDKAACESNLKRLQGILKLTKRKAGVVGRVGGVRTGQGAKKEKNGGIKNHGIIILQQIFEEMGEAENAGC